jgi:DNA-binding response OmpR family regulator
MAKGQILVVDDNPNLLELIRMRLESADYDVTATGDELEAVRELKEKIFDLCIVDLMLANGDGLSPRTAASRARWKRCAGVLTAT